jgi:hypothetical protein
MDELQQQGLKRLFAEQCEAIPMVAKLAKSQGIRSIEEVEEAAPLLFQHTMYKSYPLSFLSARRFDQLTKWLDKLTSVDLSKVDASQCDSIDGWLDHLTAKTVLDTVTSSGSSGTMSFVPKSRHDWRIWCVTNRILELQRFGEEPSETALTGLFHVAWPIYADGHLASFRAGQYLKANLGGGREDHFHPLYPERGSADLMWLAAQLRAAAARGDASRVEVPPALLARRAEVEQMQSGMAARQQAFIYELVEQLHGQRIYCSYPTYPLYQVAMRGLERGMTCAFAPDSIVGSPGGAKGNPVPPDWDEYVKRFFGVDRVERYYGMTEMTALHKMCTKGRYHFQPWVIPYLLNPDSGQLLPRHGIQRGRAAFVDLHTRGHWAGIVTGDEIEIDFDEPCGCGQTTVHMSGDIVRFSEKQGGDDKINCAAAPQAHADAMEYLLAFR